MENNFGVPDAEISMLAQFIDVLEVIENMDTIEEIRDDIKMRKEHIKGEIEFIKNKSKDDGNKNQKGKIIRLV